MYRPREFKQVDVFASAPFLGNPLAAVVDGTDLPAELMQRFARWTNLSETVFLLPPSSPDAGYAVRIFTPFQELPFAGHPTLGAARAWLDSGGTPRARGRIVQECGAGLVPIVCDGADLAFQAPATRRSGPIEEDRLAEIAAALGVDAGRILDHQWVDDGPGWAAVEVSSAEEVLALEPDFSGLPEAMVGVVGARPEGPRRGGLRGPRLRPGGRRGRGPGDGQSQRLDRPVVPRPRGRPPPLHSVPGSPCRARGPSDGLARRGRRLGGRRRHHAHRRGGRDVTAAEPGKASSLAGTPPSRVRRRCASPPSRGLRPHGRQSLPFVRGGRPPPVAREEHLGSGHTPLPDHEPAGRLC